MSTGHGDVGVVQIGGLLTQKIVTTPSIGAEIQAGEVFGLLRLGSAFALYVPSDWVVHVKVGQTLVACETVLASMPKKRAAPRPGARRAVGGTAGGEVSEASGGDRSAAPRPVRPSRSAKSTRPKQAGGESSDGSAVVSADSLVSSGVSPDISPGVSPGLSPGAVETPGASLTVSSEPVPLESDPVSAQEPDQSKEEPPGDRGSVEPEPDDRASVEPVPDEQASVDPVPDDPTPGGGGMR